MLFASLSFMLPVILVSAIYIYLLPDLWLLSVKLESCYMFSCWIICSLLFRFSITPPPVASILCVLVLVFFMLNVILIFRLRPWFVYSLTLSLDLPSNWPAVFLTSACVWLWFLPAPFINPFFHSHSPVHLDPSPHTPSWFVTVWDRERGEWQAGGTTNTFFSD